jgi:hypothetical protein
MQRTRPIPVLISSLFVVALVAAGPAPLALAADPSTCGVSGGITICMSLSSTILSGIAHVEASASPAGGEVDFVWAPTSGACVLGFSGPCHVVAQFGENPGTTNDYSFDWPTQKFLDGSGSLQARAGGGTAVSLTGLALSNGNISGIQLTPADWQTFLPSPTWSGSTDPIVVAAGDGADNQDKGNQIAESIAQVNPPLFLYLGDVYEHGTYGEMLNHYGWNVMDGVCPLSDCGSLAPWGQLGAVTQPTIGNHELDVSPANDGRAWQDYWHQRPLFTSYTFGNALFIDLNCGPTGAACSFGTTSAQYAYVSDLLAAPHPPCVLTYWHIPALSHNRIQKNILPMWALLADHGGTAVLNGHVHHMEVYGSLNDKLQTASPGEPAMTQIVAGAGAHGVSKVNFPDPRMTWALGSTPGAVYVTLNGAANGGTPTSISYAFEDANHQVLTNTSGVSGTGTIPCTSSGPSAPTITGFSPPSGSPGTLVAITGTGFTDASDVRFNGASVGAGNFIVDSDSQVTATVQNNSSSGPITVVTPNGSATSSTSFSALPPPGGIARIGEIGRVSNASGTTVNQLSITVGPAGVAAGDEVVIAVGAQTNVSVASVTDSRGNPYNVDVVGQNTAAGKSTAAIVLGNVTTPLSPGDTITVSVSNGLSWGAIAEDWTGLTLKDQSGTAASNGTPSSSPSITTLSATTSANEAVFGVLCVAGSTTITKGSSFSNFANMNMKNGSATRVLALESRIVGVMGVQTATFSLAAVKNWVGIAATYP